MEIDVMRQLEDLLEAFGIRTYRIRPKEDRCEVDIGLRKILHNDYDFFREVQKMAEFYEECTLYLIKDMYEENYISFKIPASLCSGDDEEFLSIGPYLKASPKDVLDKVIEQNDLPLYLMEKLKTHYYGVPYMENPEVLEAVVITQAGYLFGGRDRVSVNRIGNLYGQQISQKKLIGEPDEEMSMAVIAERYRYEKMLMEAIRTGDLEKVIEMDKSLSHYGLQPRSEDTLRDVKNLMIVYNTLFRKAVQEADVHPAHIHSLSDLFAKKIESCRRIGELKEIRHEMIRKYCLLVRNRSLKGYSQIIQDTLNYIDFNLKEPLTLKYLAEKISVNASYLSTQFKKETGKTLTDYVNEKRINSSLVYLATTELPIQAVAEQVGINDENYYSRLFKKYQNHTAMQYRNLMQSKA